MAAAIKTADGEGALLIALGQDTASFGRTKITGDYSYILNIALFLQPYSKIPFIGPTLRVKYEAIRIQI